MQGYSGGALTRDMTPTGAVEYEGGEVVGAAKVTIVFP